MNNNNNNNNNNCNNSNNTDTINSCNLKNNYNQWCNVPINLQQQLLQTQTQEQLQQQVAPPIQQLQQVRVSNWIADTNKMHPIQQHQQHQLQQQQHRHHHQLQQQQQQFQLIQQYNNNNNDMLANNNNNNNNNNNQALIHNEQQQAQLTLSSIPNYMSQQQYQIYRQTQQQHQPQQQQQQLMLQQHQQLQQQRPIIASTTCSNINDSDIVYYQQRLQQQQATLHQPTQQQQQQHRPLQVHLPMVHSPYNSTYSSSPSPTNMIMQQAAHISPHLQQHQRQQQQQQQQQQPQQHSMRRLVSMDGIQSGVPTLTTSTLTPTTLRNIEETFIQLTSEPVHPPFHAGFKPPSLANFSATSSNNNNNNNNNSNSALATTTATTTTALGVFNGSNLQDFNEITTHETESEDESLESSWNAPPFNEENSLATTDNSSAATDTTSFQNGSNGLGGINSTSNASSTNDFTAIFAGAPAIAKNGANNNNNNNSMLNNNNLPRTTPRRGVGGRRPTRPTNMSPEEEEKRRIRRERNKEAAARCRKRRVDQTNELLEEVAQLEKKREALQKDIESLNVTKQELEYILEAHRPSCPKIRNDILSVNTFGGLIAPTTTATSNSTSNCNNSISNNNNNNNNSSNNVTSVTTGSSSNMGGLGVTSNVVMNNTTLSAAVRSMSPIDIKPVILHDQILNFIKNEPLESALDSNSSLDHEGPTSPKRQLLASSSNPMIPPPLPLPNVASITASLNTPIVTTAPVSFGSFSNSNATLNTLNALNHNKLAGVGSKPRPNTLPTNPRHLALNVDGKPPTDINGVAIQTPSTGVFNFDSLMDGGTGLTPVSGPLIPTCSSQNKHPLELTTPTSEPSKLVSL